MTFFLRPIWLNIIECLSQGSVSEKNGKDREKGIIFFIFPFFQAFAFFLLLHKTEDRRQRPGARGKKQEV